MREGLSIAISAMIVCIASCASDTPARPISLPGKAAPPRLVFLAFEPQQRHAFDAVVALEAPSFSPTGTPSCSPALVDPIRVQIQNAYAEALQAGFQSVLLANGYTLTGPFIGRDQMTYGEKEKAILLLVPHITFDYACQNLDESVFSEGTEDGGTALGGRAGVVPVGSILVPIAPRLHLVRSRSVVRVRGNVVANTRIELALVEPLTGEKMWLKTLTAHLQPQVYEFYEERDVLSVTRPLVYRGPYGTPTSVVLDGYDGRPAALANALTAAYATQVAQFEQYFAPAEIAEVIKDAQKVRQLKRY